jgi:hypothetical protein
MSSSWCEVPELRELEEPLKKTFQKKPKIIKSVRDALLRGKSSARVGRGRRGTPALIAHRANTV